MTENVTLGPHLQKVQRTECPLCFRALTPHHGRGEYSSSEVYLWSFHHRSIKHQYGYKLIRMIPVTQNVKSFWVGRTRIYNISPWPTQTMKLIPGYCSWSVAHWAQDAAHNHRLGADPT